MISRLRQTMFLFPYCSIQILNYTQLTVTVMETINLNLVMKPP